ncbi:MAG TPA: radical SAM protein [Phycisphaerae bacterium]|nr:radical SAM protein [Phycisphaerae bacterium]
MRPTSRASLLRVFAPLLGRVPIGHLGYLWRRMRNEKPHRFAGQIRINTFFPPYPSPAFNRFCEALAARRRVPFSVYLAATGACPCDCRHCSYGHRRRDALSPQQALDLVAQAKALGACTLGLTGGEPLLRDDLESLALAAKPEMATIVFTTGCGLDAARARRLADAGVDCVTVGVESSEAAAHDAERRREGSFAEAAAAVRACREAGLYTALSTIGFREKLDSGELDRLYDLASRWKVGELRVLAPVATGGLAGCASTMLSPEEYRRLGEFHVRHNCRRGGPAVACFAYLESDAMFGCGAGYHHLFIDAGGEVCPCDLTPLGFGNATAEPLADIWTRMERFFPAPRRGCLMRQIGRCLPADGTALPLPREASEGLCAAPDPGAPLPEGYRRLLRNRAR